MFLLRPDPLDYSKSPAEFTFQYVSIKTVLTPDRENKRQKFTFQYVSIKTQAESIGAVDKSDLHSNMFLLRRVWWL